MRPLLPPPTTTTDLQGMWSQHDAGGVYLDVWGDHRALFGYEARDLIGRSAYELFHPEDLVRIAECHGATLDADGPQVVEYRLRCADGDYVEVRTTSTLSPDGSRLETLTERLDPS